MFGLWLFLLVVFVPILVIVDRFPEQVLKISLWGGWFLLLASPFLAQFLIELMNLPYSLRDFEPFLAGMLLFSFFSLGFSGVYTSTLFLWAAGKDGEKENEPADLERVERAALKALERDRAAGLVD